MNSKKFISLFLALIMLCSLSITVFAESPCDICGQVTAITCPNCQDGGSDGSYCPDCDECQNCGYSQAATSNQTTVSYTGKGTEQYTLTVPSTLAPGASGDVKVTGTWASNRKLTVTAPTTVKLTNNLNSNETKNLAVTFTGIAQTGDNEKAIEITKSISVAAASGMLFGTWTGTISYTVSMGDAV